MPDAPKRYIPENRGVELAAVGSALHVMLFLVYLIERLCIFNRCAVASAREHYLDSTTEKGLRSRVGLQHGKVKCFHCFELRFQHNG
jgi:hypothetical protein